MVTEETTFIGQSNGAKSQDTVVKEMNGNGETSLTLSEEENGFREKVTEELTEEVTSVSHEESVKFTIRAIIDPRDGSEITIEQVRVSRRID